ncbi:MAG: phospholipid carrier-dependent glycosyltransferase [Nostoc sp. DedVER02]|uniref:glycosyltransferase family 39 protein n=1 Tax=unclassified Nostoc TaxID=2593658 RepID=UPI002AD4D1DC|nr:MULTISPECIES: phospholipid carrier-dependent glycosyltransferase [unclassified Nostoc]MDZ7984689.1 phospholipid carrier-dependent glycosyltransferase [Nostoc sp. DedVER02]MDZ8113734.1 phospholipid carrier-dependent glycosyltransferase [Nostoc sp. DedVER01b]
MWLIIGISLRLTNLTAKPPWTDEFSTLVFSLGNTFSSVPLDQAIAPDILLQPLQPNPAASIGNVVHNLVTQDTHPPLYFVLAHLWMKLFPSDGGLISLFGARALPALIGAASIPCIYVLGRIAFRSQLVGHLAAAMMAVSPYGIFLSQEARHYSLAALWVIASFTCLVIATRHLQNRTPLPISIVLFWVGINALGVATHYFFTLTLCTEAVVLIFLAWLQLQTSKKFSLLFSPNWWRIYAVATGTIVASLIWLPIFLENRNRSNLTEWIRGSRVGLDWLSPIFQALGTLIAMISLLPVESSKLLLVIPSGIVMLTFFIWAVPILLRSIKIQLQHPENRIMIQVFIGVVISAIALFFIFTYFLGIDLTRGARYNFVYFPAIVILLGASLAVCWHPPKAIKSIGRWGINGKKAVMLIWLMGFFSAVTVICNLGYQKYYRPEQFVRLIQQTSPVPVLIATTHKTYVHTGEMMGVAREIKLANSLQKPLFLLAHQDKDPNTSTIALENTLKTLPRPFDLWLVNFHAPVAEAVKTCIMSDTESLPRVNGYEYKLYHCQQS